MTAGPQWPNLLMEVLFVVGGLAILPLGIIRLTGGHGTSTVVGALWVVGSVLMLGGGLTLLFRRLRKRPSRRW